MVSIMNRNYQNESYNSVKYYRIERVTSHGTEFIGNVRYSQEVIKKIRKQNNNKKISHMNKVGAGLVAVSLFFGATGGIYWLNKGLDAVEAGVGYVVDMKAENDAYRESLKPVAYTNYSNSDIANMDIYEKINLYRNYIAYVDKTAELPYTYQVQGLPDELNYSKALYKADEAYDNWLKTYSGNSPYIDKNTAYKELLRVVGAYQTAINMIDNVYNGHYSLNIENVDDTYQLIENVVPAPQGKALS